MAIILNTHDVRNGVQRLAEWIQSRDPNSPLENDPIIIGVLDASFKLVSKLSEILPNTQCYGFVRPGETPHSLYPGRPLILVDTIFESGDTMRALKIRSPMVKFGVLLDKGPGLFRPDFAALTLEMTDFLYGFGLDPCRGLNYIGSKPGVPYYEQAVSEKT